MSWTCDGEDDCADDRDESANCTIKEGPQCQPTYFRCDNPKCIPEIWKCDYENNCGDNSDELKL